MKTNKQTKKVGENIAMISFREEAPAKALRP
jgi:hypothetical protein